MNDEIKKILQELLILSIEATETKKCTVFMNYTGHVDWLEIAIHKGNWQNTPIFDERKYIPRISSDKEYQKYFIEFLNKAKSKIKELLNQEIEDEHTS